MRKTVKWFFFITITIVLNDFERKIIAISRGKNWPIKTSTSHFTRRARLSFGAALGACYDVVRWGKVCVLSNTCYNNPRIIIIIIRMVTLTDLPQNPRSCGILKNVRLNEFPCELMDDDRTLCTGSARARWPTATKYDDFKRPKVPVYLFFFPIRWNSWTCRKNGDENIWRTPRRSRMPAEKLHFYQINHQTDVRRTEITT